MRMLNTVADFQGAAIGLDVLTTAVLTFTREHAPNLRLEDSSHGPTA